MMLPDLLSALRRARNAALVVGAGISASMGIPLGYDLPMQFGADHQPLLKNAGLFDLWAVAHHRPDPDREAAFVAGLVRAFQSNPDFQIALLGWMKALPAMEGDASDDHASFVLAWFGRVFRHLITTNWDFLLETQADALYDQAYGGDPFAPIEFTLKSGATWEIEAERLFFLAPLEADDFFWQPRWDIISHPQDLGALNRWSRPLWKIHGSPFVLACPRCGGHTRWKTLTPLEIGQPCPVHPDQRLVPEITFWGQSIDVAYPRVWKTVKARLQRCDMIVACGFSGSGSDIYIRRVIENNPNAWVVNPGPGAWDTTRVHFVEAYASDLAAGLWAAFAARH